MLRNIQRVRMSEEELSFAVIFNASEKQGYRNDSFFENVTIDNVQLDLESFNKTGDETIWMIIDGILFFAIIFGNILTIYAILLSRTISRIISNRFILSLAISDLIVGFMVLYHLVFHIYPELGNIFEFCMVRLVLISLACTASVFNVLGIAIDRYVAIVYPLHYHKIITKRSAKLISCIGWVFSFAIALMPTYSNKWNETPSFSIKCEMGQVVHPLYVITMYLPIYIILYTGMCVFYIKIIKETRRHAKRMNQLTNDRQSLWKSIQVLTLVLGSFTISYTPFVIVVTLNSLLQKRTSKTMSTIYKITYSLVVANSAVNPIIYAWKNQDVKKSFCNAVHCKSINSSNI